ncbi:transglycosylase SLT domain-containing protein [Pengzhenrongella frigida]|uniref:Lytic transglycosylase domain-containing protein n=1 Tax=Pengzhenrongella frigida TaxID=1259133 RepID=A0A4Q5MZ70_9MICO|nr:transglycosylase SLT domain-containing protein [Cellulomonas sp. HLT2-17]RYV49537.1 lytic transglycosylase domain-containing protein [Cellulomonas sp. HLT2-17]
MIKALLGGALGFLAVPAIAILALGVGGSTMACLESSAGGPLAADAPVPAAAREWVAQTKAVCPDLPEAWIAAVMAQESGFRPDAYADDSNGGTWGLLQMNQGIWTANYGHNWTADLNANGIRDVVEPDIHARIGGQYLCGRLNGVREIRAKHPDWASSQLPILDALIIAHNAGESRLRTYPALPAVTAKFITTVGERVAAWSGPSEPGALPEPVAVDPIGELSTVPVDGSAVPQPPTAGCMPRLGSTGSMIVPAGTPNDVATAVQTAMSYVGVRSGWTQLCDRLACRAYGYVNSGYPSAKAHWLEMVATGHAHPGDTCPPLGSFVFWNTGRPFGHVSVVVQADSGCDPNKIMVTANEVFDSATGNRGGVYLLSFAHLNAGYVNGTGYLGWTDPVCRGAQYPVGAPVA